MYYYSVLKKVFSILDAKQKRNFVLLVIIMFFAGILESIGVSLIIPVVYVLMDEKAYLTNDTIRNLCELLGIHSQQVFLSVSLFILGLIYIIKNLYLYFQIRIQNRYIYNNRSIFLKSIYSLYINKKYEFFINNSSGNIVRSIYNDVIYSFAILQYYITILTECIISLILFLFLLYINIPITLIVCAVLLIELLIITKIIKPIITKAGNINLINSNNFFNNIIQSIESIKEIKVFNKEKYFIKKNATYSDELSKTDRLNGVFGLLPKLLIEGITFSFIFFVLSIITFFGFNVRSLIPILSAFAFAAIKLLPSINKMSSNLNAITYYVPNLENIINVINANDVSIFQLSNTDNNEINTKSENLSFDEKIEFKNVYFRYNESSEYIFDDLNLTIQLKQSIGIIGSSGAGKTTFVDLLTGLLLPDKGGIYCDDININKRHGEWLNMIGYIPQNTTLINDSIKSNIAFGIEENLVDEDKIWRVLGEANIEEYVRNLDNGIYTNIGDRGIKLSGGQKQRIGIARALYKEPKILIFDEATSALDNDTEKEVMKAIDSLMTKKTIIIIAHRLTTIKNCDVIFKVENGKIFRAN